MSKKGYSGRKPKIINGEPVVPYKKRRHNSTPLAPGGMTTYGRPAYYAYQIEDPKLPEPVPILNTPGGWWANKYKVEKLIDAFRMDCSKKEACYFAGISISQLQNFIDKHPHFKDVIDHCKEELGYHARRNLAMSIKVRGSVQTSKEYLEKKEHKQTRLGKLGIGGGALVENNNGIIFMDFSNPDQKEPVPIDPTKVHVIDPEEVTDTDDAKS